MTSLYTLPEKGRSKNSISRWHIKDMFYDSIVFYANFSRILIRIDFNRDPDTDPTF
jgi:hypothetical protein